ncbi:MAG: hypothetical protein FJW27_13910 [Acidimicrobiia bacterium]|nr:hypothetical protein [Acidimicrobiia bacterium]
MTQMRFGSRFLALALLGSSAASCGDVARQGQAPVYLVIENLTAKRGGGSVVEEGSFLNSDVITNVTSPAPCTPENPCPTIFNDVGRASFVVRMKDITVSPTSNNSVTINRYRVVYRRADGRNTQGVDVPYAWEGAATVTVPEGGNASMGFELVRHAAKRESPPHPAP